jgi:hypothetical protein
LSKRVANADQGLWNINSAYQDRNASSVSKLPLPTNRSAAELTGSNPISKPIKNEMPGTLIPEWGFTSLEEIETTALETFNASDTFASATLPTATAASGNQALNDVKSQSSGWIKSVDDRVLPPNLSFDRPIGSHRSPELARGKMTVKEVKINTFSQLAAAKMPWHPEKSDVDSAFQKKQTPASFIDSSNFSYTPPPVAHKIEITEMQKPQRAVFKNTNPAPEIAQGNMSFQTKK